MSIALDAALYLREKQLTKPLSLAERGVLFTLVFRVGSNTFSWVSQETLAQELDISERQIRTHLSELEKKGFIKSKPYPHDKRKQLYSIAEFLINYHQESSREVTKNYRKKTSDKIKSTGSKLPLNSGSKFPVTENTRTRETQWFQAPQGDVQQSKVKESKVTIKANIKNLSASDEAQAQKENNLFDRFWQAYPRKRNKIRSQKIWIRKKLDSKAEKIIQDVEQRINNDQAWKDEQFIPHPSTYLLNERWEDDITLNKQKPKKESHNEMIARVCFGKTPIREQGNVFEGEIL